MEQIKLESDGQTGGVASSLTSIDSKILRDVPVFQHFHDQELTELFSRGKIIRVPVGNHVVIEGEPSRGLFLLLKGFVSVFKKLTQEQVRLATLQEGAFIGEISLFDTAPRSATILAEKDCVFFVLEEEPFHIFLKEGGPERAVRFYKKCAEFMAHRFRIQNDDFLVAQAKLWEQAFQKTT